MEPIPRPSRSELRNFGLLFGAILALLFGVLPLLRGHHPPRWPFALCVAAWIFALLAPSALAPVHAGWTRFGLALGWVNTRIVLSLIFFLLIVPVGLVMRLLGRDKLGRRFEAGLASYRVASRERSAKSMEKPY
jgi:hypothetical protein